MYLIIKNILRPSLIVICIELSSSFLWALKAMTAPHEDGKDRFAQMSMDGFRWSVEQEGIFEALAETRDTRD